MTCLVILTLYCIALNRKAGLTFFMHNFLLLFKVFTNSLFELETIYTFSFNFTNSRFELKTSFISFHLHLQTHTLNMKLRCIVILTHLPFKHETLFSNFSFTSMNSGFEQKPPFMNLIYLDLYCTCELENCCYGVRSD